MKKIIFFTNYYSCLPIAMRTNRTIPTYICYLGKPHNTKIGDGLINKVSLDEVLSFLNKISNQEHKEIAFIFDFNFSPELSDELKKKGYFVIGSGKFNYTLEKDRYTGLQFAYQHGIKVPKTVFFNNIDDGIKFLKTQTENFVFKPCGDDESSLTIVPKTNKDLLYALLELKEKNYSKPFILQRKVEGIEISCDVWMMDGKVLFFDATLERKRYLNDDLGSNCGCSGDVVWIVNPQSRLVKEGIGKIIKTLSKMRYTGCIDLNTIVDEKNAWGLEYTPRMGYNATFTLFQLFNSDIGEFLYNVTTHQLKELPDISSDFGLSVRLWRMKKEADIQISYPLDIENNIWLWDSYKDKKTGKLFTAGYDNEILVVIDKGETIEVAQKYCYEKINKVDILDVGYRTDIGDKALDDYKNLVQLGWL